ncbi:MAG: DMT family transporter [Oscillospiraceae bacterium]|nr:DMT family transporter [Oscillospiraceae bacterium]
MQRQEISSAERRRGTLCVFFAAVLYSIGGLCIKVIPWNGMSINSARNMVAMVVVGFYLLFSRHKLRFNRWIVLGMASVCGTNVLFSLANKLTTAANTIVLQFTAPVFVIVLSIIFWKKQPQKLDIGVCILVLVGVVCFFMESLEMGGMLGNILALISGVTYAGVFLLNDLPDADPISSVFWGDFLSVILGFPFLLRETEFTPAAIGSVVILGAFQVGLAYVLMCIGLRTTPAVTASLISGIEPVLNPILVAVFYHEQVGPLSVAGAVIVILSVVGYNVIRGRKEAQQIGF